MGVPGLTNKQRERFRDLSTLYPSREELRLLCRSTKLTVPKAKLYLKRARANPSSISPRSSTQPRTHGSFSCKHHTTPTTPTTPNRIGRALLLHAKWINAIFAGKRWELRSFTAKLGWFYLLQTKSGGIVGHARLVRIFTTTESRLQTRDARNKHHVSSNDITCFVKKKPHVWVMSDVVKYNTPLKYQPKRGCVIWATSDLPHI